MNKRGLLWWAVLTVVALPSIPDPAAAQETAGHSALNMTEMQFLPVPALPTCSTGSVQSGDPTTGPSIILAKADAGCSFPWHWHTPNERLMMVTGVARLAMKDGGSTTLRAGGFAMMPSRHVHEFVCIEACALYVYSDAAFDIHYVDAQGKEISPDAALSAVGETAAKAAE